jgi:uncharacterized protein
MIKIPVAKLDRDGIDVSGSLPPSFLDIEESEIISCPNNSEYQLHVALVNNGILLTGSISTVVALQCGRCLIQFEKKVENKEICRFYEKVTESELDVTEDLREDLIVNFPLNSLCNENCKGLCPVCGGNLNETQCKCKKSEPENNVWGDLDGLNIE